MMTPRSLLAEAFIRPLYLLVLLASLWVLLRGHNAPGGGFVGGLMAAAASAAYALVLDVAGAARRLPMAPSRLTALGVLLALLSGVPSLLLGQAYLTHAWLTLPLAGFELPLSTVLVFDVGVYLSVWGALAGYCLALLQEGEDEP